MAEKAQLRLVAFYIWTASLEKILTTNNLIIKQGMIIEDWCCMCKRNGENKDHLLHKSVHLSLQC
jgi:hypothetical protein